MDIFLGVGCVALVVVVGLLGLLLVKARDDTEQLRVELTKFDAIRDLQAFMAEENSRLAATRNEQILAEQHLARITSQIESHRGTIQQHEAEIAARGQQLKSFAARLGAYATLDELRAQIEKQRQQVQQYNQVLGNFKTADELRSQIRSQSDRLAELKARIGAFETIEGLNGHIRAQQAQVAAFEGRLRELHEVLGGASTANELHARIAFQKNLVAELEDKAREVEEAIEMQEFGFYRPRFDFPSSSDYQKQLDRVRAEQTRLVKDETAVKWEKNWIVEGSEAKGRKMMAEQTKLMLRAFNGECDAAVARVKYNNATTLESRIAKACEQINKLGKTNTAAITDKFLQLKLQELYLVHEHRLKQQAEKEEQTRIREQMREEEKVREEIEAAEREAEKEEAQAAKALEKARLAFERATQGQRELNEQTKVQNQALAAQVAKLESELKEAIDRKAKAIARAQLTKSGHVYILSNVGSFGENVYKVGMTRRLEPLERVKELGDASVPFNFDVHAMIYSEDAPALENKLHQRFADRRVNLVNLRREYFHVTLEEIIDAVSDCFGQITFVKVAEAAEYRETLAKRKSEREYKDKAVPMAPLRTVRDLMSA